MADDKHGPCHVSHFFPGMVVDHDSGHHRGTPRMDQGSLGPYFFFCTGIAEEIDGTGKGDHLAADAVSAKVKSAPPWITPYRFPCLCSGSASILSSQYPHSTFSSFTSASFMNVFSSNFRAIQPGISFAVSKTFTPFSALIPAFYSIYTRTRRRPHSSACPRLSNARSILLPLMAEPISQAIPSP